MHSRRWDAGETIAVRGAVSQSAPMILLAALLAAAAPSDIVRDAPRSAWVAVAPENLVVLSTPRGDVVIELAPGFAPAHVAAIRALVRSGAFDGGAVVRVQDNYVVQFAARENAAPAAAALPAEYDQPATGAFTPLRHPDSYAAQVGFVGGWPVARGDGRQWLVHCYAMVGAGRDMPPSTGDGSELYAVNGQAPRHLDRNIALVGRVLEGVDRMAARPRGTADLGFYATPAERLEIVSARIASDIAEGQRPAFQFLDTDSASFAAWAKARANRTDGFFVRPAGAADVCNVMTPVRTRR